ncbi:putative immunogenic protein NIP-2 [Aphelenchoides avenae]|nr:putative immunogenic protein NIP-2 [Aphelenchus avenae]
MPFRKFKPQKQYGVHNTKLFKEIWIARNKRSMNRLEVPKALREMGVDIHDPNDPSFFAEDTGHLPRADHLPQYRKPTERDHPLWKAMPTFLFDGSHPFTDGMDQACALINATKVKPFPTKVYDIASQMQWPKNLEDELKDCIMHGERYDPTLEKLPRRHDPIIFWQPHPRMWGTPVVKRNNIILSNLYRKTLLWATFKGHQIAFRCDHDEGLSSYLSAENFGVSMPLVVRHEPHLIVQSDKPTTPLSGAETIKASIPEKVPDVYPVSPLIDLSKAQIYNETSVIPRLSIPGLHLNFVAWSREQDQKYPWTTEQNAANAIVFCFGAALAQAFRDKSLQLDGTVLRRPVLAKAVQLVNGRMDLVAVQLNNLNLADNGGIKNFVWVEKSVPLYKPVPYYEKFPCVEDLNLDTFKKFAGLLLYR